MSSIGTLFVFTNNTIISSTQMNSNFADIKTAHNAHEEATAAHGATGAVVGTTNIQTLTNKTLTSPTINTPAINTPTIATPTVTDMTLDGVLLDGTTLVTEDDTQTLTNKTLTSPVIAAMGSAFTIPAAASTPEANTMCNEAIIKAWGQIDSGGNIMKAYNVNSVTKTGTGSYQINYKTPFSVAGENIIVAAIAAAAGGKSIVMNTNTTQYCLLLTFNGATATDLSFYFIAIGAQ